MILKTKREKSIELNLKLTIKMQNIFVKRKDLYKVIRDETPYSIPSDYLQWSEISKILASFYRDIELSREMYDNGEISEIQQIHYSGASWHWLSGKYPIFLVTKDLLELLMESKFTIKDFDFLKELIKNLDIIMPSFLLLFPRDTILGLFKSDNEDRGLDYQKSKLNYDHCFLGIHEGVQLCSNKSTQSIKVSKDIHFCSLTPDYTIISEHIIIPEGNEKLDEKHFDYFMNLINSDLSQIIIQVLLIISSKPELLITSNVCENFKGKHGFKNKGFGKNKNYNKKNIYPRVLDMSYVENKIKDDDPANINKNGMGTGSPKRPHWRLGYTVDKPIGKMKGIPKEQWERKRITVKPYLVKGNADQGD